MIKVKITKEQAAITQLSDAIELYQSAKYVSAITLAAASEEILSQFIRLRSEKTGIPYPTAEDIDAGMFDMFKDFLGIRNYHSYRNKIRNELKHHGQTNKDTLSGKFDEIALDHIAGSIRNYKMLHNKLPTEKTIIEFCESKGIN